MQTLYRRFVFYFRMPEVDLIFLNIEGHQPTSLSRNNFYKFPEIKNNKFIFM